MHQLNIVGAPEAVPVPAAVARAKTPEALFAAVRADDSARALVTFYDETTGERMELSAASLGNWVAKTHFLLMDELGLGPGDRAFVDLPLHWQRLVVWFGVWSAGLDVVTDDSDADVAFVGPERGDVPSGIEVYALALAPWGKGFEGTGVNGEAVAPEGTQDFVVAVRPQPDAWASVRPVAGADDPAFDAISRSDLIASARALAAEHGLGAGARVAISDTSAFADRPDAVLAVLSVAGSLVLTRGAVASSADAASVESTARRDHQERVTHRL